MKTRLLIPVIGCMFFHAVSAQNKTIPAFPDSATKVKKQIDSYPSFDLYGAIPFQHKGGGGGMGIFGPSIKLGNSFSPLHLRMGGEFYIMELSHRSIRNVPLSAPQTGNAKVRLSQNTLGFNLVARFSSSFSQRFTPYGDLLLGANNYWTGMKITPDQYQEGYEESSSENLASFWQFSYGASAGVLWGLGKHVKLNTGIMYVNYFNHGELVDISKATISSGNLTTENTSGPRNLWVLKVGLTFIVRDEENKKRKCHCDCDHSGNDNDYGTSTRTWDNSNSNTSGSNSGGKSNSVNVNIRSNK